MTPTFGRRAWADLGGEPALLDLVEEPRPPVGLSARLDVAGLLRDGVALATLAIQQVQVARGRWAAPRPVTVDGARVATAAQSERHLRIDGRPPEVWAPLSGFWRAADGWVRTHGNYPHHAARLARLLGVPEDAAKDQVAAAVAKREARELEDAAAACGAIVGAVRTPEEWAGEEQAVAVADLPLIDVTRDAGGRAAAWTDGGAAPLAGVRVLDLTRVLAGPVATRDLALAGADVLRVDAPGLPETDWIHLDTGAGKRSTLLDLATAADGRTFDDLLRQADVVVTGYRPGALDRFGLSAGALADRRPGLVVASVSAWGATGPWSTRRGFDSIVQAVTGVAMLESGDGATPGALPAQALDHSAGHFLAAAVAHGLHRQRLEGGTWAVAVALARIAHALTATRGTPPADETSYAPVLQTGRTAAGEVTCAAPPLTYVDGPTAYPALATPWGTDPAAWR